MNKARRKRMNERVKEINDLTELESLNKEG